LRIDFSDLGHAPVDEELDASDVATFVGSEEGDYFGYFVQGSGATEGYVAHEAVGVLFDLFILSAESEPQADILDRDFLHNAHR
jgi:hypothetical protein